MPLCAQFRGASKEDEECRCIRGPRKNWHVFQKILVVIMLVSIFCYYQQLIYGFYFLFVSGGYCQCKNLDKYLAYPLSAQVVVCMFPDMWVDIGLSDWKKRHLSWYLEYPVGTYPPCRYISTL
ncbi:hypothetical protein O6H91_Y017300 [Diphasiastrum complanatum]|nr:hypothetical protein O6H91_Y017300 [Diphasiastrum complanatum]